LSGNEVSFDGLVSDETMAPLEGMTVRLSATHGGGGEQRAATTAKGGCFRVGVAS
jgi:hypothetical protein